MRSSSSSVHQLAVIFSLLSQVNAIRNFTTGGNFTSTTAYRLSQVIEGSSFFDQFDFYDGSDPTHGFVDYVSRDEAETDGLISITDGVARLGVDSQNRYDTTSEGRRSVRIESKFSITYGLVIADIAHMPGNACGTWPAFWTLGAGAWPYSGEIDIIEGVSEQPVNSMALHTQNSCTITPSAQLGTLNTVQCAVTQDSNTGCSTGGGAYGDSFNSAGGGVYAMEWTPSAINIWYFARANIPASILSGSPCVEDFGTPQANFEGGDQCDIPADFKEHRLIFNTAFCGDWAGNVFGTGSCPTTPGASPMQSCINYVADNPESFKESFWEINDIRIYQKRLNPRWTWYT